MTSLKYYRDLKNSFDTAREEGREEGRQIRKEEGERKKQIELARGMKKDRLTPELIAKYSGLSIEQIAGLDI